MWKTIYTGNIKKSSEFKVLSSELKKASTLECGGNRRFSSKHHKKIFFNSSLFTLHCFILFFILSACSAAHYAYSKGLFDGKEALKRGDYTGAKRNLEEAYQNDKSPDVLMYLAIVDYKTNNLDNAEKLIRAAEAMSSGNYHYLRVLGYKALILLNRNRDQGLEALDQYVAFYALHDPLMSINDVSAMARSGNIDIPRLENLVEEQVSWFENDIELYWSSGVGFYDRRGPFGGSFRFHGGGIFR
jgi:hypothetical protein